MLANHFRDIPYVFNSSFRRNTQLNHLISISKIVNITTRADGIYDRQQTARNIHQRTDDIASDRAQSNWGSDNRSVINVDE